MFTASANDLVTDLKSAFFSFQTFREISTISNKIPNAFPAQS